MSAPVQHYQVMVLAADAISAGALLASFIGWAPPLAALGALAWYVIQVWESKTVQGWLHRRKQRKLSQARVIARLVRDREREHQRNSLHAHHPMQVPARHRGDQ